MASTQASRLVAPVFANPSDLALRSIVADSLLEIQHPWGTLIAAQLGKKPGPAGKALRASEAHVLADHLDELVGPLAKIGSTLPKKRCFQFANGFLDFVRLDKRKVPRDAWAAAAKAPHWATVRHVEFSVLEVPIWFIGAWAKNKASMRSLCAFTFSGLRVERANPGDDWIVASIYSPKPYGTALAAFVEGMPRSERARMSFAPKLAKKHRAWVAAAVAGLGTNLVV